MNTQTAFEIRAIEQAKREALVDALRAERAMNPSESDILRQRIATLEQERDEAYREYAEMIRDLQEYFPGATGMHAIYKGIEAIESQRDSLKTAMTALMTAWPEGMACETQASAAFDLCYEAMK
jgi:hypothetical protein